MNQESIGGEKRKTQSEIGFAYYASADPKLKIP